MIVGEAQRLRLKFERAKRRASSPDLSDDDRAWLAEIMTIWASSYLEVAFRDTLRAHARQKASPDVAQFVDSRLKRTRNPNLENLLQLAGAFNPSWRKVLEDVSSGVVGDSINSIVSLRHQVAHGRSGSLSVARIVQYFEEARTLPRKLSELCESSSGQ